MSDDNSSSIKGLNRYTNSVPANRICTGCLVTPKHVRLEPFFAVPICVGILTMSFPDNPMRLAKAAEIQQPALLPESTNACDRILLRKTGTNLHAFIAFISLTTTEWSFSIVLMEMLVASMHVSDSVALGDCPSTRVAVSGVIENPAADFADFHWTYRRRLRRRRPRLLSCGQCFLLPQAGGR